MKRVDWDLSNPLSTYSDNNLTILFDISRDWLFLVDPHGLVQKVSQYFLSETGYTESELVAKPFYNIIHPKDIDQVFQLMQTAQNHQIYFNSRCFLKHDRPYALSWSLIKNNHGYYFLSAKPLNRIPSESKVGISEIGYQKLIQNGSELLGILNLEGIFTYVGPTLKTTLGYDPSFYIGKNAFDFVHPEDLDQLLNIFSDIHQNYKLELPHYRFIDSNGKWHWLETIATNLLHDPDIKGILINARDITAKKEIEEEKFRLNRRFNGLIENNKDAFFTLSPDWTITSFNSSTIKLIKGQENLLNINLWEIFPDWKGLSFYTEFKRSLQENKAVQFEEFSPQLNRWFDVTAYPHESSLTVFIRDISELKIQQLTLSLEKEVLEMTASSNCTLKEIVDHLLEGFEKIHLGLKASLSLSNKQGTHLYPFSVPSMPAIFEQVKKGLEISGLSHPCSQAAYFQREIIIPDLESANQYPDFKGFFRQYHLQTCHALPILSDTKKVLGTLAIFKLNRKQAINDENGLINRLGAIIRTILENYQSKENIHLSNERYRLTSAVTHDAIWDWDLLNQDLYYGEGFKDYFDHNEALEAHGIKKWEANLHPADARRVTQSLWKALNQGVENRWQEQYRYKKANGTYALVIDKAYIIRDENHQAMRVVGAMQDITDSQKNLEKLRQSEENYKMIFSNNPTPMWTYNLRTHKFSMVNDAALNLHGYTRDEFLNLNLYDLRAQEEHQRLRENLAKNALHKDFIISGEWKHVKKDGTIIIVEVVSHLVKIDGQKSRLIVLKDITAEKKAKQEILEQNQKLREIAYISSHEIRKPAANILGLVNLFDKQNLSNKLNAEIIGYLETTAQQLDQVIGRIAEKTGKEM